MVLWKKIGGIAFVIACILVVVLLLFSADSVNKALSSKHFEQVQLEVRQEGEIAYTLKKDGDMIHVTGSLEQYHYTRNGKEYVLVYDDFYSVNKEDGEWIEYSAEEFGGYTFFDFSVFSKYSRKDFKKMDGYYIPRGDVDAFYCEFFGIKKTDAYTDCEVKFYIEKGKVTSIEAKCLYNGELEMSWDYIFSYKNERIQVPKADIK